MAESRNPTIAEFETTLTVLHRREMRLRSILSSALVSPKNREAAREALEDLLKETRGIEDKVRQLEANR
jgi:hypothetical protein